MKAVLFFCLCSLFALALEAQSFYAKKIGTKDGLSNSAVNCIYEDDKGFIWVGTDFGLNRVSANAVQNWFHDQNDKKSILGNKVYSIAQDAKGNMWLSFEDGVSIMNPLTGQCQNIRTVTIQGRETYRLSGVTVYSDKQKNIWIASRRFVFQHTTDLNSWKCFDLSILKELSPKLFSSPKAEDEEGNIWIASSQGIFRIHKNSHQMKYYALQQQDQVNQRISVAQICVHPQCGIMVSTWGQGLFYYDRNLDEFIALNADQRWHTVLGVLAADSAFMLSPTEGPLLIVKVIDNKIVVQQQISFVDEKGTNIPASNINLYRDGKQNLWLLDYYNGLYLQSNENVVCSFLDETQRNKKNIIFTSLLRRNGNELILSSSAGLMKYDTKQKQFFSLASKVGNKLFHKLYDFNGGIEAVGLDGVHFFDQEFNLKKHLQIRTSSGQSANIYCLQWHKGIYYLGSRNAGLFIYDPSKDSYTQYQDQAKQLINSCFSSMLVVNDSIIAMAKSDGLVFWNTKQQQAHVIPQLAGIEINKLILNDGLLWIASHSGLYCYHLGQQTLKQISIPARYSSTIDDIAIDAEKKLWLLNSNGILVYNPAKDIFVEFNDKNLLPGDLNYFVAAVSDNKIMIGSVNAIILLDSKLASPKQLKSAAVLRNLLVDGTDASAHLSGQQTLVLAEGQNFSVELYAYDYLRSATYYYFLNNKWVSNGNKNRFDFNALSPGKYSFKFKMRDELGRESFSEQLFTVKILAPVYKRWWFLALLVLLVLGLVTAWYQYSLNQLKKIVAIRNQIANDLHDDIGATLSSIAMLSDVIKKEEHLEGRNRTIIEKINIYASKATQTMSDIVWAINPEHDKAESLVQKIRSFALNTCNAHDIKLHFVYDTFQHDFTLAQRKNIYLIFKEALNNALKYSGTRTVYLKIEKKAGQFHLQIQDEGNGFDVQNVQSGNGLRSMQMRAVELGGQIQIRSDQKGTLLDLICPL